MTSFSTKKHSLFREKFHYMVCKLFESFLNVFKCAYRGRNDLTKKARILYFICDSRYCPEKMWYFCEPGAILLAPTVIVSTLYALTQHKVIIVKSCRKQSNRFQPISGARKLLGERCCDFENYYFTQERHGELKVSTLVLPGHEDTAYVCKNISVVSVNQTGYSKCQATQFSAAWGGAL